MYIRSNEPSASGPILVVNCGSSSVRLAVFDRQLRPTASAHAERLGDDGATAHISVPFGGQGRPVALEAGCSHHLAITTLIGALQRDDALPQPPCAIGHRVVHGGETFSRPSPVDANTLEAIRACAELAPLHNPVNLRGIECVTELYPESPQVAVFDTAFHQTLPEAAFRYALPARLYRDFGVRRYGFHGISHEHIARRTSELLDLPRESVCMISAHLGNGCSITAIENGRSVDTSMGLTPLEGLVMGTRSGDVDPGLFGFLLDKGFSADAIQHLLNRESGLAGLSGLSNDMRLLLAEAGDGHAGAELAVAVFCFRLARYIGAMMASLSRLDALVFTGGIGEHSATVRDRTLAHLSLPGFRLDDDSNRDHGQSSGGRIEAGDSRFRILVVPTDEEGEIARATADTLGLSADDSFTP